MYVVPTPQSGKSNNSSPIVYSASFFFSLLKCLHRLRDSLSLLCDGCRNSRKSPVSVVGTRARLRAGRYGVRIPEEARNFSLLQYDRTNSGDHSAPPPHSMGTTVRVAAQERF